MSWLTPLGKKIRCDGSRHSNRHSPRLLRPGLPGLVAAIVLAGSTSSFAQGTTQFALPHVFDTVAAKSQNPQGTGGDNAQQPPAAVGEAGTKPTRRFFPALGHNLFDDLEHVPRRNSLYWLAAGATLAFLIHPVDDNINNHLIGHSNPFIAGKILGQTGFVLGGSVATYLVGRFTDSPRVQHIGMDEIEAALLSEGMVQGAKRVVRRDRPLLANGAHQKGFSLPSGHATITFAAATVLQQHLGYRAAVPTYLVASYVAISRLHDNRHFASDVIMGAATGIIIGRSVTWHGRNFYASPQLLPGGGAIVLAAR